MEKKLNNFGTSLGYHFKDKNLLELALSHRSSSKQSNERLEFLGDSLLNFIIAEELFKRYPDVNEGELSRLRANLVNGVTLAEIAKEFNIGEYLLLGAGEIKSGGTGRDSILADAVEAVIGAIYLDNGIGSCKEKVLNWFAARIANSDAVSGKDSKTKLQELLQAMKLPLPNYKVAATDGKPHEQVFHVECNVKELNIVTHGIGASKRKAEQEAAELFLQEIKKNSSAEK